MEVKISSIEYQGKPNGFDNNDVYVDYNNNTKFRGSIIGGEIQKTGILTSGNLKYTIKEDEYEFYDTLSELKVFYNTRCKISKVIYRAITWYPIVKDYYFSKVCDKINVIYVDRLEKGSNGTLLAFSAIPKKPGGSIYTGKFDYFNQLEQEGDSIVFIGSLKYGNVTPIAKNLLKFCDEILKDKLIPKTENDDYFNPVSEFLINYQKDITGQLMELKYENSVYHYYNGTFGVLSFPEIKDIAVFPALRKGKLILFSYGSLSTMYTVKIFRQNIIELFLDEKFELTKFRYKSDLYMPYNARYFKAPDVYKFIEITKILDGCIHGSIVTPDGIFTGIIDGFNPRRGELEEFNNVCTNIYKHGILVGTKQKRHETDLYTQILNDKNPVTSISFELSPKIPNLETPLVRVRYIERIQVKREREDETATDGLTEVEKRQKV